jgi:adenylate cyclase
MPVEIERKFLVCGDEWRREAEDQHYCQGYLARSDGVTVRARRKGKKPS